MSAMDPRSGSQISNSTGGGDRLLACSPRRCAGDLRECRVTSLIGASLVLGQCAVHQLHVSEPFTDRRQHPLTLPAPWRGCRAAAWRAPAGSSISVGRVADPCVSPDGRNMSIDIFAFKGAMKATPGAASSASVACRTRSGSDCLRVRRRGCRASCVPDLQRTHFDRRRIVLRVADLLEPVDGLAALRLLDREVRHRAVRRRAVPVLEA